jgi:trimeric autotransporter adhesin
MIKRLLLAGIAATALLSAAPARAQSMGLDLGIRHSAPSAAAPTWAETFTGGNNSCAGTSTCTLTGVTVNPGFVVAGVWNYAGTTYSSVTLCGISLTQIVQTATGNNQTDALYGGTIVSGGSCSLVAVTAGNLLSLAAGVGTLTNLTSSTATSSCTLTPDSVAGPTYSCSSAITIPSNGFGILFASSNTSFDSGVFSSTNMTIDAQPNIGGGNQFVTAHSGTAGTITPALTTTDGSSQAIGMAVATWH